MGTRLSRIFAIRCLLIKKPYTCLIIVILLCAFCLSYVLKVIEGPATISLKSSKSSDDSAVVDFSYFENCFWVVMVTMTTGKFRLNWINIF
jgi:hypothetical protein